MGIRFNTFLRVMVCVLFVFVFAVGGFMIAGALRPASGAAAGSLSSEQADSPDAGAGDAAECCANCCCAQLVEQMAAFQFPVSSPYDTQPDIPREAVQSSQPNDASDYVRAVEIRFNERKLADFTILLDDYIDLNASVTPAWFAGSITWESSDSSVVTVEYDSADGSGARVTAVGSGTAFLTVTAGDMSTTCNVRVKAANAG